MGAVEMAPFPGRRPKSRFVAVLAAGLMAAGVVVAGCNLQPTQYGFDIWNYSSNRYVVRLTFLDGTARVVAMPPRGIVFEHSVSNPQQAVVYDQTCSTALATLKPSGSWAYVLIDASGAISVVASPLGSGGVHTDADPSYASPEPIPSLCPAG
jgi:hypothetical protein